jgi:hypothetical protein
LRYYNVVEAHKLFGSKSGEIPLTYYLLKNTDTKNDTVIYDNAKEQDEEFNIYEYNFVPTESVLLWKKLFTFTKKYGNLKDKYSSVKGSSDLSVNISHSKTYPIISIVNKNIQVEYSNINNNKNVDKKLLLANSAMGYPIYDYSGIMYPKSSDQFMIFSNNNEKELRQLQNYFLSNLLLYLINIIKTRQKFFDNKIFEVIPDITKITKYVDIDDKFLIKTFKFTENDLIGYNNYITYGEGRLEEEDKNKIRNFKLSMPKNAIKLVQKEMQVIIDNKNKELQRKEFENVKKITKRIIVKANKYTKKRGSKLDIDINSPVKKSTTKINKSQYSNSGGKRKTQKRKSFLIWS